MTKQVKIIVGVLILAGIAILAYVLLSKKTNTAPITSTSTTTGTGLHGFDLGSIFGSLLNHKNPTDTPVQTGNNTGTSSQSDMAHKAANLTPGN